MVVSNLLETTDVEPSGIETAAACFAALADPNRLRILAFLAGNSRCVCHVQEAVGLPANLVSYHLRILREAGLVVGTRRGRWLDYRVADLAVGIVESALRTGGFAVPIAAGGSR